ncbi:hypothetical protein SCACP_39940 [Sporomusa carbonis]|uniref:hypothetical protein n=1 Tax=Sporomusa carbonis TaxID=3076075 RepID=UPI003A658B4E
MTETDRLITERVLPFREKILEIVKEKHPYIYSVANAVLSGNKNMVGLQVTQGGRLIGEYTFHLDGMHIERVDTGKLDSGLHHPFLGLVKPYAIIERSAIERILADENFSTQLFGAITTYLPDITIKFLR